MTLGNPSFLHLAATGRGGAGCAAIRIHEAITASGFQSQMVVGSGADRPDITVLHNRGATVARALSKATFKVFTRPRYYFRNQQHDVTGAISTVEATLPSRIDAIVAHALTDFMSFEAVARLASRYNARVLWSLMDMASFTGGCHYAWECTRYQDACGVCPALRLGAGPRDWSAKTLRAKHAALAGIRSTVVAASTWLADQARKSALFRHTPVEIVPLSVSPEIFAPHPQLVLKSELGLDHSRPVIFFGARDHGDARKGMGVLYEALVRLARLRSPGKLPTLLVAGDGAPFEPLIGYGFAIRQLGLLPPDALARAYSTADLYVSPSVEDSGPMMINEAVMCGTPVVAFDIGVANDLIEHGSTGIVAPRGDADALSVAMANVLDWSAGKTAQARARARQIGLALCSPEAQANSFARLALANGRGT